MIRFKSNNHEQSFERINEDNVSGEKNNKMKNIIETNRNKEIYKSKHDERILIELYSLRSKYRNNLSYSTEVKKFKS